MATGPPPTAGFDALTFGRAGRLVDLPERFMALGAAGERRGVASSSSSWVPARPTRIGLGCDRRRLPGPPLGTARSCSTLARGRSRGWPAELEPSDLDAILVTHLHPDHFVDLVPLRHYLRWHLSPSRRVRVLGPAGLADRLDGLHAEPGFSAAALDIEDLWPSERCASGRSRSGPAS